MRRTDRIRRTRALVTVLLLVAAPLAAQFTPPRIQYVVNESSTGRQDAQASLAARVYYIDKGQTSSINKGDVLNVYREKRVAPHIPQTLKVFIGTMLITNAYQASSVGKFTPNEAGIAHPIIRHKTAMTGDIVVPRLVIDNSVLFDPGQFALKQGAAGEFQKVADFVQMFSPAKLIIEGHTDADGDADANLELSEQRAKSVTQWLVDTYPQIITAQMVEARGYGEEQPIVPNDTDENKKLNRRIEVLVWE